MGAAARVFLLVVGTALIANNLGFAAPAVAPAPSGKSSPCTLPNGAEIVAPEQTGTSTQYYTYYYSYSWSYYSYYYYSYYYYGRKLLQSKSVPAPSPSSAPRCCPSTSTKQGDTVSSLISGAGLPDDSKVFFYAINPSIQNGTDALPTGSTVTVPCYRITEYYRLNANAQAPATAVTG